MDQLPFIQSALDDDPLHNFGGVPYEIAGTLLLPDGSMPRNLNVRQITPGVPCVKKVGGWIRGLDGLVVNRGDDPSAGSITVAGLHLQDVAVDDVIQNVEVTGHGKGTGIYFLDMHGFRLGRGIKVHDMTYSCPTVSSEQIFGIWFNMCSRFHLQHAIVDNLGGIVGAAPLRNYQSDGITISGSVDFAVGKTSISRVGEGIDVTGTLGNRRFLLEYMKVSDCDAFGVKIANSAADGVVRSCRAERCGWSGYVISGASEAGLSRIEQIQVTDSEAIDTGSANWATSNTAGFSIMQGAFDTDFPRSITFLRNTANDTRSVKQMKYGFRNDNGTVNRMANCTSIGHTINSVLGTFG